MGFLSKRRREREWMDEPDADPVQLGAALRFLRRVNSWLGYTRATLGHLDRLSKGWARGETIRIIDLATGSADVPRAILGWAERKGWDVRVVGVDRHGFTARSATEGEADSRLAIVQGDVFDLPFEAGSFDYAITSLFLHHLDDDQVVEVLRVMGRLARRGVIVSDLLRHYRAYAWITFFTLFSNAMLRHDARVSVAQSFTRGEILRFRDAAGLDFARYYRQFGHRFVLCGEKSDR
jgi:SAM-dependent methyltransferase